MNIDRQTTEDAMAVLDASDDHVAQFFAWSHLPERMQFVSLRFGIMAAFIIDTIPKSRERTVALRKLLESKDAAVRAAIAK